MADDRSYEAALAHLASLQSNLAVTSLFSKPLAPTPDLPGDKASQDPNAPAIPEMLAWLRRAGIEAADLGGNGSSQQQGLRCVHVAGTKGKGSVCAFLTSILARCPAAGRVGTYTSPHLVSVRERILLDGVPIRRDLFARYFFEVWDALTEAARAEAIAQLSSSPSSPSQPATKVALSEAQERELRGPATKPFYFRFLTILALHAFRCEGIRTAVVECGIGGEHDATNVLPPAAVTASVVAQLGLDHVAMLGDTVPKIARHKAGVCKRGRRCFTRRLPSSSVEDGDATVDNEVMRVLRGTACEKGAVLVELDDAAVARWGGVSPAGGTLGGEFQVLNQALAVAAAREHLRVLEGEKQLQASLKTPPSLVPAEGDTDYWLRDLPPGFVAGLRSARLGGRCETRLDGNVTWLVDGAHTADSLREVARWFVSKRADLFPDDAGCITVLFFNQQERDAVAMLRGLMDNIARSASEHGVASGAKLFDYAIFTRNDGLARREDEPERDLSVQRAAAEALRGLAPETQNIAAVDSVAEAVGKIKNLGGDGKKVVVLATGSLHLVGALLRTLEPEAEL